MTEIRAISYRTSSGTAIAAGNQWAVGIGGLGSRRYCYRIEGASSTTSTTYSNLLGSQASPTFSTAAASRFAVIGDWGQTGSTAPGYANSNQSNVLSKLAGSGASFVVGTGDIGYPDGTQSNYGDLIHTGSGVSGVFGPSYWPVPGKSLPMYPVPGNHGFTSTFTSLWPSTSIASGSAGKAANGTYSVNGATVIAPDYWFAHNINGWRVYNLTTAWLESFSQLSAYAEDYKQHWAPGAAERTWLQADLAKYPTTPKIAVFHYPLYSAVHYPGAIQDGQLTRPTDGSQSVEDLLASNKVKLVLNGHSHIYERNNPHNGLVSIISGGGGGNLGPVDSSTTSSTSECAQTYPDTGRRVVALALGWSSTGGSSCNTAKPTSAAQVYHFLRVTVTSGNKPTATVEAINSLGGIIDSTTVRG